MGSLNITLISSVQHWRSIKSILFPLMFLNLIISHDKTAYRVTSVLKNACHNTEAVRVHEVSVNFQKTFDFMRVGRCTWYILVSNSAPFPPAISVVRFQSCFHIALRTQSLQLMDTRLKVQLPIWITVTIIIYRKNSNMRDFNDALIKLSKLELS